MRQGAFLAFGLVAWLATGLFGCNNRPPLAAPARFDRLNRTDFVCVNTVTGGVVELKRCRLCAELPTKEQVAGVNCRLDTNETRLSLFALVTQSARGEIAAINLQSRAVIDSRRDIPGYTYEAIGVLPSGVAVPKNAKPTLTYVASFGSRDLRVLNTTSLVVPPTASRAPVVQLSVETSLGGHELGGVDTSPLLWPPADSVELQRVPLEVDTADGRLPAAPTELALSPDEDALIVSLRDVGKIMWLPLVRCATTNGDKNPDCHPGLIDPGKAVVIDLRGSASKITPVVPAAEPRPYYQQTCGDYRRPPPEPPDPVEVTSDMLTATPRPSAFAFDTDCDRDNDPDCRRRLLVADESLPFIHAIDLDALAPGVDGTAALLPPIVVGAPTSDVVATPRVPVVVDVVKNPNETRYVYAIDATDGSVLVTERGELLKPSSNPGARVDRLTLGGAGTTQQSAVRLAVLTPTYAIGTNNAQYIKWSANPSGSTDDNTCLDDVHTTQIAARLRGVFLAVALSDGTIRIVDIHDRELFPTASNIPACRVCPDGSLSSNATKLPNSDEIPPSDNDSEIVSTKPTDKSNYIPMVVRHEARLAANFIPPDGTTTPLTLNPVAGVLHFAISGRIFPVGSDGSIGTPDAPSLCHIRCDSDLVRSYPIDETLTTLPMSIGGPETGCTMGADASDAYPPLVCGTKDGWGASDELWNAEYDGFIPGTITGVARTIAPDDPASLSHGAELFAEGSDFCSRGILGREDMAEDDPACAAIRPVQRGDEDDRARLAGDQIVILDPLLGDYALQELRKPGEALESVAPDVFKKCKDAKTAMDGDATLRLGFEILRAHRDRLVLWPHTTVAIGKLKLSFDEVRACLGGRPWSFEVHSLDAFTVVGSDSGFVHRVKAVASDGHCIVDKDADPQRLARTRQRCPFRNRSLQFQMRELPDAGEVLAPGVLMQLQNQNPAVKLILNATRSSFSTLTIVPSQLRYNDVDHRLYLVDISDRGLVTIPLDPFPAAVDSSGSFN